MTKSLTDATGLEYMYVEASQFDVVETLEYTNDFNEDIRDKILLELRKPLGGVFLRFSSLEHEVELWVCNLFSEKSSYIGMQVNKFLDYSQKTNLLNDMLTSYISWSGQDAFKHDAKELAKQLDKVGALRNIIAHAKWFSLTKEGYVRSQVKLDKGSGVMKVKYYKINKDVLDYIEQELQVAEIMLYELQHKLSLD